MKCIKKWKKVQVIVIQKTLENYDLYKNDMH